MRLLFFYCSLISSSVLAQSSIPPERWLAPALIDILSVLNGRMDVCNDTVFTGRGKLKPEHVRLSATVLSTSSVGSLTRVRQFCEGGRCGTWITLDPEERVKDIEEFHSLDSVVHYWYDEKGRLEYYCKTSRCYTDHQDQFELIFARGCPGTCLAFDSLRRITYSIHENYNQHQVQTWFYENGKMATRRIHADTLGSNEQWCPRGKRVGYLRSIYNSQKTKQQIEGTLVGWSKVQHAYYLVSHQNEQRKLQKIPYGRWHRYDEKTFQLRWEELGLELVGFDTLKQGVVLPCRVKAQ